MSHHNDNEIVGLPEALKKLPGPFRAPAGRELRQALFGDGYADFEGPELIHYRATAGGPLKSALLVHIYCDNFIFDLFFVPVRSMGLLPVVGRAYLSPPAASEVRLN